MNREGKTPGDVAQELEGKILEYLGAHPGLRLFTGSYYVEGRTPGDPCYACAIGALALACGLKLGKWSRAWMEETIFPELPLTRGEIDHVEAGFEGHAFSWMVTQINNDDPFYKLGQRLRKHIHAT